MNLIRKPQMLFLLAATLLTISTRAETVVAQVGVGFTKVESLGDDKRYFYTFTTAMRTYTIRQDGWSEGGSAKILRRNFQVKLGRKGQLTRFYYCELERDVLFLYEVKDGDFGWGFIERMDQTNLQPRWVTAFNGFNLGPGLVDNNSAYLSASNLLARIDLGSGRYIWQHDHFAEESKSGFSGFQLPVLTVDRVLFREDTESGRTIQVDKATGKIIKS
ncbi:MAG TPA: hypothetical protein VIV66_07385 [Pyrinomonadaceae bacterium]